MLPALLNAKLCFTYKIHYGIYVEQPKAPQILQW